MRKKIAAVGGIALTVWAMLWLAGCANHADFVEVRDHLSTVSKSQDQDQKRLDALQRRVESLGEGQ
jgi:outer membrane murein-binding lipoprotein Lpp